MLRSITGFSNPDYKVVGFRRVMDDAPKSNYTKPIPHQWFSWL